MTSDTGPTSNPSASTERLPRIIQVAMGVGASDWRPERLMRPHLLVGLTWLLVAAACSSRSPAPAATPATLVSLAVTPDGLTVELGMEPALTAMGRYSDGSSKDLTATATWGSSASSVATVAGGQVTTVAQGAASIQASVGLISGSSALLVGPPGHRLLGTAGLYVQFERRGYPAEYWPGQVLQDWDLLDAVTGHTRAQEVAIQLDAIAAMGVNAITYELRSADPGPTFDFTAPACDVLPVLGVQFPQPTATELTNLARLLDAAQARGIRVLLRLTNNHMEQQPPTGSQTWLGAILGAVGTHPALDLVLFEGTPHLNAGACGVPAEPPLFLGPGTPAVTYVKWAIGFGMSLGLPASKLSAEAIVGAYILESQAPAGANATDNHLWSPLAMMKSIFDELAIPADQRTYAISFYEARKCTGAGALPCTDLGPHEWADATLAFVTSLVGPGPRIVAPEMGSLPPVDPAWPTARAVESLGFLMRKHGIDGGAFYRWTNFEDREETDPTLADPVKRRGVAFAYNPVQREFVDLGGFHLPLIPNGSFEGGLGSGGVPERWAASGSGSAVRYLLSSEPGQPEVPSRGVQALRLVTGPGAGDAVTATSSPIPVLPSTTYTTTANLRFAWTGDPDPAAPAVSRPQVSITVRYLLAGGTPSALRVQDRFSWYQEDATAGFATFPVVYTTPADAARVQIWISAARNGLPTPITLDADNLR